MRKTVLLVLLLLPVAMTANINLKTKFSDEELVQILKDDGYSAVKIIKNQVIRIRVNGRTFLLINYKDGDLQLHYAASGVSISYKDINKWNSDRRLSRAYLDSDKDPVLESDLMANAGLTSKHVTEFFRVFRMSVKKYVSFLQTHDKS